MYERSGTFYTDFMHKGRRYVQSLKTGSKAAAKELERKFRYEVETGEYDRQQAQKKMDVLFSIVLNDYIENVSKIDKKSWQRDEQTAKHLKPFFGKKNLLEITGDYVTEYKNKRRLEIMGVNIAKEIRKLDKLSKKNKRRGKVLDKSIEAAIEKQRAGVLAKKNDSEYIKQTSFASITKELNLLKRIFNLYALQKKANIANPVKGIKLFGYKSRTRTLSEDEEERLFAEGVFLSSDVKDMVTLALYTGMRRGEIFKLQVKDVVLPEVGHGYLFLKDTKTGDNRQVPLNQGLAAFMKSRIQDKAGNDYVFGNGKKPIVELKRGFSGAMKRAGIEGFRFHDLRHTFCTRLAAQGISPFFIMKIAGHKNTATAARYSNPTENHLLNAMPKIKSHQFSQQGENEAQKKHLKAV